MIAVQSRCLRGVVRSLARPTPAIGHRSRNAAESLGNRLVVQRFRWATDGVAAQATEQHTQHAIAEIAHEDLSLIRASSTSRWIRGDRLMSRRSPGRSAAAPPPARPAPGRDRPQVEAGLAPDSLVRLSRPTRPGMLWLRQGSGQRARHAGDRVGAAHVGRADDRLRGVPRAMRLRARRGTISRAKTASHGGKVTRNSR